MTGDQAGTAPFSQDVQSGTVFIALDLTRGEAQGLGDAQTRLEECEDEELIPKPITSLAGGREQAVEKLFS